MTESKLLIGFRTQHRRSDEFGFFAFLRGSFVPLCSAERDLFFDQKCSCISIRLDVEGRFVCHEDTFAWFSNSPRSLFFSTCTCNKARSYRYVLVIRPGRTGMHL